MHHFVGRLDKAIKRSLVVNLHVFCNQKMHTLLISLRKPSEFNRGIENVFREAKFGSHHFDLLIRVFEHFDMLDTSTLKLSHSTSDSPSKLNNENMQRFLAGLPQLFEKAEEEWRTFEGEGDDIVEEEGNELSEGDALCALGGMFEDGLVVVVDVQAAFDIYQRLSARGHSTALCGVGWFYDLGGGVVEPDKQRAFHYYQLASDKVGFTKNLKGSRLIFVVVIQGNLSAQRNVAILHSHEGIPEADPRKGIELYEDIITKTEGKMLNAVFSLAYCYDNGKGTAKDPRKAAALYKQAADHGHDRALVNLGVKVNFFYVEACRTYDSKLLSISFYIF